MAKTTATQAPPQPGPQTPVTQKPGQDLLDFPMRVLSEVDAFYSDAFETLLWSLGVTVTIAFAVVGILIPLLIERWRKQSYDQALEAIRSSLTQQTQELVTEQLSQNRVETDARISSAIGDLREFMVSTDRSILDALTETQKTLVKHIEHLREDHDYRLATLEKDPAKEAKGLLLMLERTDSKKGFLSAISFKELRAAVNRAKEENNLASLLGYADDFFERVRAESDRHGVSNEDVDFILSLADDARREKKRHDRMLRMLDL